MWTPIHRPAVSGAAPPGRSARAAVLIVISVHHPSTRALASRDALRMQQPPSVRRDRRLRPLAEAQWSHTRAIGAHRDRFPTSFFVTRKPFSWSGIQAFAEEEARAHPDNQHRSAAPAGSSARSVTPAPERSHVVSGDKKPCRFYRCPSWALTR